MTHTAHMPSPDSLHRLVKAAVDSGEAGSFEEAEAQFRGYRIALDVGRLGAVEPAEQLALYTAVTLARRVFLGGVTVTGELGMPNTTYLPFGRRSVGEVVRELGGVVAPSLPRGVPVVTFGAEVLAPQSDFHLQAVASGWRGGVVPAGCSRPTPGVPGIAQSSVLAAGLAISEAYFHLRGSATAGRRELGMSLWRPAEPDWMAHDGAPPLRYLPSRLWLIGLGHLGQAYLWSLGALPYGTGGLSLTLQDTDEITAANESTSVLTEAHMAGRKKVRAMASWAEQRGFGTTLTERSFGADTKRGEDEPAIALCGLDNAIGRRHLDRAGFSFVVEAGLGRGHADFQKLRVHTLPGRRAAAEIWKTSGPVEDVADRAAYRKLIEQGVLDRCGATTLAGRAVGAPFVGAVAASLAVSEILRLLHGGELTSVADIDLRDLDFRSVVGREDSMAGLNPGYVEVA